MREYFTDEELNVGNNEELQLAPGFRHELNTLRDVCGVMFVITSGCRSPSHNKSVGGVAGSFHLSVNSVHNTGGCCAVDISTIRWTDAQYQLVLKEAAARGWSIGENRKKHFIHIDRRIDFGLKQIRFTYP